MYWVLVLSVWKNSKSHVTRVKLWRRVLSYVWDICLMYWDICLMYWILVLCIGILVLSVWKIEITAHPGATMAECIVLCLGYLFYILGYLSYVLDISLMYPLAFGLPATVPKLSSLCLGDPRFETEVPSPNDPFVISVWMLCGIRFFRFLFKKGPKKDPKSCRIRSWAPLGFPLDPSCPTPETRMDKMTKKWPKTDFVTIPWRPKWDSKFNQIGPKLPTGRHKQVSKEGLRKSFQKWSKK